jgi:hypothetical protein
VLKHRLLPAVFLFASCGCAQLVENMINDALSGASRESPLERAEREFRERERPPTTEYDHEDRDIFRHKYGREPKTNEIRR